MTSAHEIEATIEVTVRVPYLLARGQKGCSDLQHPDAEPDEPDVVDTQAAFLAHINIMSGLNGQQRRYLEVLCESHAETIHE